MSAYLWHHFYSRSTREQRSHMVGINKFAIDTIIIPVINRKTIVVSTDELWTKIESYKYKTAVFTHVNAPVITSQIYQIFFINSQRNFLNTAYSDSGWVFENNWAHSCSPYQVNFCWISSSNIWLKKSQPIFYEEFQENIFIISIS